MDWGLGLGVGVGGWGWGLFLLLFCSSCGALMSMSSQLIVLCFRLPLLLFRSYAPLFCLVQLLLFY
ncbi:hypothetical protein C2I18_25270 [Paenibacillus sp. PK3_47]|nr:hypothetical protein C2I18_25270 [Paenibacillus sp. PK3_47]